MSGFYDVDLPQGATSPRGDTSFASRQFHANRGRANSNASLGRAMSRGSLVNEDCTTGVAGGLPALRTSLLRRSSAGSRISGQGHNHQSIGFRNEPFRHSGNCSTNHRRASQRTSARSSLQHDLQQEDCDLHWHPHVETMREDDRENEKSPTGENTECCSSGTRKIKKRAAVGDKEKHYAAEEHSAAENNVLEIAARRKHFTFREHFFRSLTVPRLVWISVFLVSATLFMTLDNRMPWPSCFDHDELDDDGRKIKELEDTVRRLQEKKQAHETHNDSATYPALTTEEQFDLSRRPNEIN